jgi:uncharacterized protein (TIGR02466 family)
MRVHNYTVFPSIITKTECDLYSYIRNDLIEWIYNYQSTTESVQFSNRGGWQSPSDFHNQESFLEFRNYILNNTFQSLTHYNLKFNLDNMWININKKNNYNVSHCHPRCNLSGVFWIKAPDNCGKLVFHNPHNFVEHNLLNSIDKEVQKEHNYDYTFEFIPKEGVLVLFPAHLHHLVEPNQSDEDRISIAFNLS